MKHERDDDVIGALPKKQRHRAQASRASEARPTGLPRNVLKLGQEGTETACVPRKKTTLSRKLGMTDADDEDAHGVASQGYVFTFMWDPESLLA